MTRTNSTGRCGLSLIELLVVIALIGLMIGLTLSAVQWVRASAVRTHCLNNARQLATALHNYHGTHQVFPPGHTSDTVPKTYHDLGWPARVLPFIEQQLLWGRVEEAFRVTPSGLPYTPPHDAILATVIPLFCCPADQRVQSTQLAAGTFPVAFTSYLGVVGIHQSRRDGVLYVDSAVRLGDITDGSSQTLLFGERPPSADFAFGWWYRGWGQQRDGSAEMVLGVRERNTIGVRYPCPAGPYAFGPGRFDNQCDMFHFWSPHTGGAHFAFADGSVRFIRYSAEPIMAALATRAGGEAVSLPD
jgi:prepilin-type N-terminal cleavage/methylation domain-containing protein/prepilin-type processing-associated H-X9-DG protein